MALVLKTSEVKASVGSNPTPSASTTGRGAPICQRSAASQHRRLFKKF
ncbi:MAG: hypothetical protein RLZZ611_797 [Cyanobacteriota bacterium]|jgi:hypothetical protein